VQVKRETEEQKRVRTDPTVVVLAGAESGSFDIAGLFDAAGAGSPVRTLPDLAGTVPITYYPAGNTAGQVARQFDGVLVAYSETSAVGGIVAFAATIAVTASASRTRSGITSDLV